MGRIKTQPIKKATLALFKEHAQEFKPDYAENKLIVKKFISSDSKRIINTITGYVTRLVKSKKEIV